MKGQGEAHILEGINTKIKVLKRIAQGYRDEASLFLKVRAPCTEIREEPLLDYKNFYIQSVRADCNMFYILRQRYRYLFYHYRI